MQPNSKTEESNKNLIKMRVLLVLSLVICLISVANATEGLAVFYRNPENHATACFGNQSKGNMVTGVSEALWDGGKACGRRYRIRCTGPGYGYQSFCKNSDSIVVTVVDFCQARCNGDFNLYVDAFDRIADTRGGKIKIDYVQV